MNIRIDNKSLRIRLDIIDVDELIEKRYIEIKLDLGFSASNLLSVRCELESEFKITSEFVCKQEMGTNYKANSADFEQGELNEHLIKILFPEKDLIELNQLSLSAINKKNVKKTYLYNNSKSLISVDLEIDAFSISKSPAHKKAYSNDKLQF